MNEIDPLPDQVKINLLAFWDKYAAKDQTLFDFPYLPSFGQYPADLELREPAPLELTDENDPAGKPGQHWDGTQTAFDIQEPPTESQDGDGSAIRGIVYLALLYAFVGVLAILLLPCIWGR